MRTVRAREVFGSTAGGVENGIEDLYNDTLDVIIVREAFPAALASAAGERLDRDEDGPGWTRPNQQVPSDDIQLLGTPATPTYISPRGPTRDAYVATADWQRDVAIFEPGFDVAGTITQCLSQLARGRAVEILRFPDGRSFAPFTVRRLREGRGISLHHDYHYPLALFSEIVPQLDTRTLISYFVTLRQPERGGQLVAYPVTRETPDPPMLPNGWAWDLAAVEQRFEPAAFDTHAGDLFVFASGRCLHRVVPPAGHTARITLGGFLALDRDRARVLYWS